MGVHRMVRSVERGIRVTCGENGALSVTFECGEGSENVEKG